MFVFGQRFSAILPQRGLNVNLILREVGHFHLFSQSDLPYGQSASITSRSDFAIESFRITLGEEKGPVRRCKRESLWPSGEQKGVSSIPLRLSL